MDWIKDFEKWVSGGFIGAIVYGLLRLREQFSADRRGDRADDRDDRKTEVDGYKGLADLLDDQLQKCLARVAELEKQNRQLQEQLLDCKNAKLDPQALRKLADELEAE